MSSIITNSAAITALQSLRLTQQALAQTQSQISTGYAVNSAADNASVWSSATTMRSDQGVYATLASSLSESSALVSASLASVNSAISVMNQIKNAVVQAENPGANTAQILTGVQALGAQLTSIVTASTVSGLNLLDGSSASANFVASYNDKSGTAASVVGTIALTTTALVNAGAGILETAQATGSGAATNFTSLVNGDITTNAAQTLSNADSAIASLTSYASKLGAAQSRIDLQSNFINALNDSVTKAVSSLVDADMNQASTRVQALQTQQQLGIQSLSIANQNAQAILKLFQ
jgi:flagellin